MTDYSGPNGRWQPGDDLTSEDEQALVSAVAGEARGESFLGQVMVALGILNRASIGMKHEGNLTGTSVQDVLDIGQVNAAGFRGNTRDTLVATQAANLAIDWLSSGTPPERLKEDGYVGQAPTFTYWYNPAKANPSWASHPSYGIADSFRVGNHVFVPGRPHITNRVAGVRADTARNTAAASYPGVFELAATFVPRRELTVEEEIARFNPGSYPGQIFDPTDPAFSLPEAELAAVDLAEEREYPEIAQPAPFPGIAPQTAEAWTAAKELEQIFQRDTGLAWTDSEGNTNFLAPETVAEWADAQTLNQNPEAPVANVVDLQFEVLDPSDLALIRLEREYPEVFAEDNLSRLREEQAVLLEERRQTAREVFLEEQQNSLAAGQIEAAALHQQDYTPIVSTEAVPVTVVEGYFNDLVTSVTGQNSIARDLGSYYTDLPDFVPDETAPSTQEQVVAEQRADPFFIDRGPPSFREVADTLYKNIVDEIRGQAANGQLNASTAQMALAEAGQIRQSVATEPPNSLRSLDDILRQSASGIVGSAVNNGIVTGIYNSGAFNLDPAAPLGVNIAANYGPGRALGQRLEEIIPPRAKPPIPGTANNLRRGVEITSFRSMDEAKVRAELEGQGLTAPTDDIATPDRPGSATVDRIIRPAGAISRDPLRALLESVAGPIASIPPAPQPPVGSDPLEAVGGTVGGIAQPTSAVATASSAPGVGGVVQPQIGDSVTANLGASVAAPAQSDPITAVNRLSYTVGQAAAQPTTALEVVGNRTTDTALRSIGQTASQATRAGSNVSANALRSAGYRAANAAEVRSEAERVFPTASGDSVFDYPKSDLVFTAAEIRDNRTFRTGGSLVGGSAGTPGFTQGDLTQIPPSRSAAAASNLGQSATTPQEFREITYFDEITVPTQSSSLGSVAPPGSTEAQRLASIYGEYASSRLAAESFVVPQPATKTIRVQRTRRVPVAQPAAPRAAARAVAPVAPPIAPVVRPRRPVSTPTQASPQTANNVFGGQTFPSILAGQDVIGINASGGPIIRGNPSTQGGSPIYSGFVGGGTSSFRGRDFTTRVQDRRGNPIGRGPGSLGV